jgi:hypothetical protein
LIDGRWLVLGAAAALAAGAAAASGSRTASPYDVHGVELPSAPEDALHVRGFPVSRAALRDLAWDNGFDIDDAFLDEMARILGGLRFPLRVWRGLNVAEGDRPDPAREIGWWTWNRQVAERFARGSHSGSEARGGTPWLMAAVVDREEDVHWPSTIEQYVRFSSPWDDAQHTDDSLSMRRWPRITSTRRLGGSRAQRTTGPGRASVIEPFVHLVGVLSDAEVARLAGTTANNVRAWRFRRRHPAQHVPRSGGGGRPPEATSIRSAILNHLKRFGPARVAAIVDAIAPGMDRVRRTQFMGQVSRLAREGKIVRLAHGRYAAKEDWS